MAPATSDRCSTIARNFMSELDALFNLDSSLDTLDKTVNEKSVSVFRLKRLQLTASQEASSQHTSTGTRGTAEAATRGRGATQPGDRQLAAQAQGHSACQQSAGSKAPTDNGHPGYATCHISSEHVADSSRTTALCALARQRQGLDGHYLLVRHTPDSPQGNY
jgi:hypothetical protein